MKRIALALPLVFAAITLARAGYDEGFAAYLRRDYAAAHREFLPLAEQGDARARYNLGLLYDNGQGVAQDYAQAVRWYRLAAEQGNTWAQKNLGVMYDKGRGVAVDYVQAHMWYNLAAINSSPGETRDLTTHFRDEVARRMTPDQIAQAQELARNFKPKPSGPAR
jgi:uncharacterized protein